MAEDQEIQTERILVSLKTLAEMVDSTRCSVRRWLKEAGISPVAVGRGRKGAIRYRWKDVEAWLDQLNQIE